MPRKISPEKEKVQVPVPPKPDGLSVGLRLFVIGFLMAVLLIPAFLMNFLVEDRKTRKNSAVAEIAEQWSGGGQIISAPILSVPYKQYFKDEKGNLQFNVHFAHFLPERLDIEGTMTPEVRYRGIYKVVLYRAQLKVSGAFAYPEVEGLNLKSENVLWDSAFLSLGMTNTKGIENTVRIRWNHTDIEAAPGLTCKDVVASGIHASVPLADNVRIYKFAFDLNHKGHEFLEFVPLGKQTNVLLESAWGAPSFVGNFLPDSRDIQSGHFKAEWKVLDLNRNFPQQWLGEDKQDVLPTAFGVNLFVPVDQYQQTSRTIKYSIMFIGLTFLALFMLDVLGKSIRKPVHAVQYLLIGISLIVFYTLLLSLSEHIGLGWAYLAACAAIIALILMYTKSILASLRHTGLLALILSTLYAYMYVVLQLEDYALLIGSLGLFLVLALVMFLTRKLDWAAVGKGQVKG
jgi:inner membrane protein